MLKTGINDLALFKQVIAFVDQFENEVELIINKNDIYIEIMDPTRVLLFSIKLKDILEKEIESHRIGLNLTDLKRILSVLNYDVIDFQITRREIKFKKQNQAFSEKFTLKTLEFYDGEEIPMSNLREIKYERTDLKTIQELREIIKKSIIYQDVLTIYFDIGGFEFESIGIMGEYKRNEGFKSEQTIKNKVSLSLSFLRLIATNSLKLFNPIQMHFSATKPAKFTYNSSVVELELYLAPRVEEVEWDDEDDSEEF